MSFDMVKFEKGQIWRVQWTNPSQVGHEQQKDRPWLILSDGKFNQSSGMVTAVPITTRDHTSTPSQVLFVNDRDIYNVVLCEQIRTFDYTSEAYKFDYMGNISRDVLDKVDEAIAFHLGLMYSPLTLKSLYEYLDSIVTNVSKNLKKTDKLTDEDIKQFHDKLVSLGGFQKSDESTHRKRGRPPKNPKSLDVSSASADKPDDNSNSPDDNSNSPDDKKPAKGRIKWTKEICQQFVNDASTLPMLEVMDKWGIYKKRSSII